MTDLPKRRIVWKLVGEDLRSWRVGKGTPISYIPGTVITVERPNKMFFFRDRGVAFECLFRHVFGDWQLENGYRRILVCDVVDPKIYLGKAKKPGHIVVARQCRVVCELTLDGDVIRL